MNPDGTARSHIKIASGTNGGPTLASLDHFGQSSAVLGDVDGDGVADLAVGADQDNMSTKGALLVLHLNADGTVKSHRKIASGTSGGPVLAEGDHFGSSVAAIGDLDGDGVTDFAVGAFGDDTGGPFRGAVYVLFMQADAP